MRAGGVEAAEGGGSGGAEGGAVEERRAGAVEAGGNWEGGKCAKRTIFLYSSPLVTVSFFFAHFQVRSLSSLYSYLIIHRCLLCAVADGN